MALQAAEKLKICHPERSEESLFDLETRRDSSLRSEGQNKMRFFRNLFSR
jgi:hypothetical protein